MEKIQLKFLAIAVTLGLQLSATAAPILSLQPSGASIGGVGGQTTVDLMISGLKDPSSALAGFSIELNFDPAIVSAVSVAYGTDLGLSSQLTDLAGVGGQAYLSDTSFEVDPAFFAGQPAAFRLATLTFDGVSLGTSALDFGVVSLTDPDANSLAFSTTAGSIRVGLGVPDGGSSLSLACLGLVSLFGIARIPRRQQAA